MSTQRHFNRHGIAIEQAHRSKAAREKQTITRTKPPRPHDSYRGAKTSRAGYCGKWGIPFKYALGDRVICTAAESNRFPLGKYMPHNARFDGGQFTPTIHIRKPPVKVNTFRGYGGRNR